MHVGVHEALLVETAVDRSDGVHMALGALPVVYMALRELQR